MASLDVAPRLSDANTLAMDRISSDRKGLGNQLILYANIVLSGKNTMVDGIRDSLTNEMTALAPASM